MTEDGWSQPFILGGDYGLVDDPTYAQIVYFAGIYDPTRVYTCDEQGCPYVYDPTDGKYYMMNTTGNYDGKEMPYPN